MSGKRVLAFGYHDQSSPRHRSLCEMLEAEGAVISEVHTTEQGFFRKCRDLYRQYRSKKKEVDTLLVTFPGHYLMPLAWLLTRFPRKRLLFDAFISLHDTYVDDRRTVARVSMKAAFLFIVDWISCHLADEIFIDTEAHKQFFMKRFGLSASRIRAIYLKAREDLFHPDASKEPPSDVFEVFFYGTFIPLHGTRYILRAAELIQQKNSRVRFTLLGRGQELLVMKLFAEEHGLKNVRFLDPVPLEKLPEYMQRAHLCLGIFGTSDKANRVIPHKIYDAVACGRPVLTRDSLAIRERFANHPLVHMCPPGNPEAIANAIITLAESAKIFP